ncbi:MAG: Phosphorylase b kinase gamma catalytic chain, skeletal muscle/heart isoform [Marteilia pararefringens]
MGQRNKESLRLRRFYEQQIEEIVGQAVECEEICANLIGYPPFWNDDQLKLIKLIVDQDYNQKLFRYKYISSEAKNIIDSLLVKNPRMRATVSEVVDSKFCKIHQMKSRELYLNETGMNDDFDINTLLTVENPYSLSIIRNIVDSCSFSIYNHWVSEDNVKKHRASLYQTDNFTE